MEKEPEIMDDSNLNLAVETNRNENAENEKRLLLPSTSAQEEVPKSRSEKMTLAESFWALEPPVIIHMCSSLLVHMTVQEVLLEKACRVDLGYSNTVCDALHARNADGYRKEEEQEVQTLMAKAENLRAVLENAFPILLVFLIGAWSDNYGRKYPMLFVVLTFIIQNALLVGAVLAGNQVGVWGVTIIASLIISLSGSQACFFSCAFSYIFDHVEREDMTYRSGIFHTMISLAITVGFAVKAQLNNVPFATVFAIALGMEIFSFVYLMMSIKNCPAPGMTEGKSWLTMFKELFDFQHVKDAVQCFKKERPDNDRFKLGLLVFSHCCALIPMLGEGGVFYLFCRYCFNWGTGEYGTFMIYKTVIGYIGNFLLLGILARSWEWSDTTTGIIACASNLAASIYLSTVTSPDWMMLGPVLGILSGAAFIVPRSMISKLIPSDEIGKVNSCLASLESVLPLIASALYTIVYTYFLSIFIGSFFIVSALLSVPPLIIFWWFMKSETNQQSIKQD